MPENRFRILDEIRSKLRKLRGSHRDVFPLPRGAKLVANPKLGPAQQDSLTPVLLEPPAGKHLDARRHGSMKAHAELRTIRKPPRHRPTDPRHDLVKDCRRHPAVNGLAEADKLGTKSEPDGNGAPIARHGKRQAEGILDPARKTTPGPGQQRHAETLAGGRESVDDPVGDARPRWRLPSAPRVLHDQGP